jgi:hypothetical protein
MPSLPFISGVADQEDAQRSCMLTKATPAGTIAKFFEGEGSSLGLPDLELRVRKDWVSIVGSSKERWLG